MKRLFLSVILAASSAQAFAQWVVVDPTNLIQNTVIAVKAVATEAFQIKQRLRELDMLSHMDTSAFSDVAAEAKRLNELKGAVTGLTTMLEKQGDINQTFQSLYGASNAATPEEFTALLSRRAGAGDASVKSLLDASKQVTRSIEQSSDQHKKIAESLTTVSGVTEAAQLTAASVGVVVQQMQALNGATAISLATTAAKDARENKEREAADKARVDYVNASAELLKKSQQSK